MALHGTPALKPGSTRTRANVRGEYSSARTYWVYADPDDSDIAVIRALPVGLQRYTADPAYAGFVVIEVEVADDESVSTYPGDGQTLVRRWTVNCTYDVWTSLLNSPDGNPLHEPPRAWWEATESTIPFLVDNKGNPVLNVVGDPYDPGLERQKTVRTLVIAQNFRTYQQADILTNWADCVNSTQWKDFAPRTLLFAPLSTPPPEFYQDGGFVFYKFEFRLLLNPDTWDKQVIEQGYRCFDTTQQSTGNMTIVNPDGTTTTRAAYPLKNILIEGEPAQEAVLLDINGNPLFPPVDKTDIVVTAHRPYNEVDFNTMPFANVVIPDGPWA